MTTWRCHTRFFSAVSASPLSRRSKLRLWRYLLRRMVWDRRDLLGELSYKLGTR
jgi:hypothetical protein